MVGGRNSEAGAKIEPPASGIKLCITIGIGTV
jgi:hypothetical protein